MVKQKPSSAAIATLLALPRTGKTATSLTAIADLAANLDIGRVLVVAPKRIAAAETKRARKNARRAARK